MIETTLPRAWAQGWQSAVRMVASRHWASGWAALQATPAAVWFIPPLAILAVLAMSSTPFGWVFEKPAQELVAPTVAAMAAATSVVLWAWTRATFTTIAMIGIVTIFLREVHFEWLNTVVYVSLALLVLWFSYRRTVMSDWLAHRWLRTWLGGAFLTYFVSETFDNHVWQFLPDYWAWHDRVEETLETLGHVQLFALCLVAMKIGLTLAAAKRRSA